MGGFVRSEHRAVAAALRAMDHDFLVGCACWFDGGTEIVLDLGEYRLSKGIDFLCADQDGYRAIRSAVMRHGTGGLFRSGVTEERAFRADQYGVRGIISVAAIALRVEVVRESRIDLSGQADVALGVPRLGAVDRIAEKLLANADRGQDRSAGFRDAVDLGMLALRRGAFPDAALMKAERAYGDEVVRKLVWVLNALSQADGRAHAAVTLGMAPAMVAEATDALWAQMRRLRPGEFVAGDAASRG